MGKAARFELAFRPTWEDVETIRSSVALCLQAVIRQVEAQEAISMVTAELLENALKHGGEESDIHYLLSISDDGIFVRVKNVVANQGKADELLRLIDWINDFDEPADAYLQRMQYIYQSEEEVVGGLGLVRVAHEGECTLSAEYQADQRIAVRAEYRQSLDLAIPCGSASHEESHCSPS